MRDLTNIMEVKALHIVAWQALQEGVAVLCSPVARLH